jgi:hypothetical protein
VSTSIPLRLPDPGSQTPDPAVSGSQPPSLTSRSTSQIPDPRPQILPSVALSLRPLHPAPPPRSRIPDPRSCWQWLSVHVLHDGWTMRWSRWWAQAHPQIASDVRTLTVEATRMMKTVPNISWNQPNLTCYVKDVIRLCDLDEQQKRPGQAQRAQFGALAPSPSPTRLMARQHRTQHSRNLTRFSVRGRRG